MEDEQKIQNRRQKKTQNIRRQKKIGRQPKRNIEDDLKKIKR